MIIAVTIALVAAGPFSLFEWVMLILATLMAIGGLVALLAPGFSRRIAAQLFEEEEFVRFGSGVGVVFGCWLIYLSLSV